MFPEPEKGGRGEKGSVTEQFSGVSRRALPARPREPGRLRSILIRRFFYGVTLRQAEILQEMMNEASTAVDSLSKAGSPREIVATSTELAQGAFEHALGNMKQLAELVTKASQEVTSTINTRMLASIDEIKAIALKVKQQEKEAQKV